MNTELRWQGSHNILIELPHGPMGPEYHKFSNVWELLDDNKRTTKSAWETVYERKTVSDIDDCGRVKCSRCTCVKSKSQSVAIKSTSSKISGSNKSNNYNRENCSCFQCGKVGHLKRTVRNWELTRINQWRQISKAHHLWTIPEVQHFR